jgi:hypothetical protein
MRSGALPCRAVAAREIAHYQEFGWAKLEAFVHPEVVQTLLDIARTRMGDDGDSNAPIVVRQSFFNPEFGGGLANPSIRPLIEQVGWNAKALMGRRAGVEVRYFADLFAPKLPASKEAQHAGNGPTHIHQDYINWALDRSGGMTFWIALTDLAPESGTMSFVNGSHRMGTLGNYRTYGEGDLLNTYPEILDRCTVSRPISYAAGDATVHSNLCVHGAGANLTDGPRWAYNIIVNPADARWTGAPAEAFDCAGMRIHQELDDERFPIIS